MLLVNVSNPGPQLPPVVNSSTPSSKPHANGKPAIVDTAFAMLDGIIALLIDMAISLCMTKDSMKIIGSKAISIAGKVKKIIGTPAFAKADEGKAASTPRNRKWNFIGR